MPFVVTPHDGDAPGAEPLASPTVSPDEVPTGTIADVLDWVGDDPTRAQVALNVEQAGQQRVTLIDELTRIIQAG